MQYPMCSIFSSTQCNFRCVKNQGADKPSGMCCIYTTGHDDQSQNAKHPEWKC